jgi:GH18 family chitinase
MTTRNSKPSSYCCFNSRIWFIFVFSLVYNSVTLTAASVDEIEYKYDNYFAIAGYLPDYRINSYMDEQLGRIDQKKDRSIGDAKSPSSSMTDLILFSLQPHSKGFFGCCLQNDHYDLVAKFVSNNNNTSSSSIRRVWVTVGGGGRSEAFAEICAKEELRSKLIRSILNLSVKYPFIKGIDLDFFNPTTIQQRENYILFLIEAIPQFQKEGIKVSITLHPHQCRLIPPTVYQLLDRIHLMSYDMIGSSSDGSSSVSNYHASLDKVRQTIKKLLQPGIGLEKTPQKVLLGIPVYSRHHRNPSQVKTFGEIYDEIRIDNNNNPNEEKTRFLLGDIYSSMHSWKGYEWDSPSRIQAKIDLAKENDLGGIFFWEIGQDKFTDEHPNGILFDTAATAVSSSYIEKSNDDKIMSEL